jgi:hypothetical protein
VLKSDFIKLRQRNVRPYVFLASGTIWLTAAIVLYKTDFVFAGFKWQGHASAIALSLVRVLFRVMPSVLFLGWIGPVLFGSWLLWKK